MDNWILQMFSMALPLFLLMDSIGNVPIFVSILKDVDPKRHCKIIFRELLIALFIILAFEYAGHFLMDFLKVSMSTLRIAGGIILFILSIKMIFPVAKGENEISRHAKEPFIVPLATPLVAGPAVLAAVMLYSGQTTQYLISFVAIFVAWGLSTIVLMSAPLLKKVLGERGLVACERLMGLVLTLIAVQMFLDGLEIFLAHKGA